MDSNGKLARLGVTEPIFIRYPQKAGTVLSPRNTMVIKPDAAPAFTELTGAAGRKQIKSTVIQGE